ncbi:homeotic protein female sterile isoform X2 [Pyrus x bretschneideri]|uniref:homeotic protein female sterile isoform X2 n=1 Tax=Pyrus x bretschneideri TaxID=225117 RepID=UPI00203078BC|nr:homeotic protein female sterile isoform X2 [Pyrus x bretschneideri]
MMSNGERRRSARLVELESRAESKGTVICYAEEDVSSEEDASCQKRRRKRVKSRPVQDLAASRNEHPLITEVGNSSNNNSTNAGGAVPSETPLPESGKLELLLSVLQKKDLYNMFAKPVNPQEVKGYNDIIKEPMDFGTISEKLSGGTYRTLEEFQHDVFLVFSNAMSYNAPSSIFNRKACDMKNLAVELFEALEKDYKSFESACSSKISRAGKRSKNIMNSSADRSTNGMPLRAQGVAEQKLQKAGVLNPCNSTSNFQFSDLDLNVALFQNGIINTQPSTILRRSTPSLYSGAQTNIEHHNGQFIGTAPSINALFNNSIGNDVGRGRNPFIADLPASDLKGDCEKVYGQSPSSSIWWRCPPIISNSSRSPAFGSTHGLNSNCFGGIQHQFQPMGGSGSTPYGSNSFEQASQGLNGLRQAGLGPQIPDFKPFQQQGQGSGTPASGISMRPINLSDIDQWFGHGRSGGGSNTGAPPASSQGLGAAETNMFPCDFQHSRGSNAGALRASSEGCDWNPWNFRP